MKVHKIILNICLVTSAGCLGAGYILGGYWLIMPGFLAAAILWMTTKKRSVFWSTSNLLLIYVVLALIGVTLNLSIYLMIFGCTTALVCWDLTHFRLSIANNPLLETDVPLERSHLQSLTTAVFSGLLLAFISSYINLQFPLGVMVILVLMAMGCITYSVHHMMKNR
jgi:hypothetical protein